MRIPLAKEQKTAYPLQYVFQQIEKIPIPSSKSNSNNKLKYFLVQLVLIYSRKIKTTIAYKHREADQTELVIDECEGGARHPKENLEISKMRFP